MRKLDECIPAEVDVHLMSALTLLTWLNQVERWSALITQCAIGRDSFRSVNELVDKVGSFVQHYNRSHLPFVWTATADSILAKITRLCTRTSGTRH